MGVFFIQKWRDNDIRIQLGHMKNTTRHKIHLNPAGCLRSTVSFPSGVRGRAPKALARFMFLEGKIQHLINVPAPNLLKLTSKKRDVRKKKMWSGRW